jgi:branched-chain amino acid transport system ATP-binding protein
VLPGAAFETPGELNTSGPPVDGDDGRERLVIKGVSVTFGGLRALDDVSLSLGPGEVLGVIGPNGAGKTTLFNIVCGFVRPTSGAISYRGRELVRHRPHDLAGLGIARTLQGVGLWRGLTVVENVMTGAQARLRADLVSAVLGLRRSSREEADLRRKAIDLLGELRIAEYAQRYPPTLPYAVQKRVALARALLAEPTLLLLDEPASGLSSQEIEDLHELVLRLRGRMAIMLVEHRMDFVISTCDRLVVLNFGRVIASGSPDEVRADPQVTTAYLGEEVEAAGARGPEETGRALD